MRGVPHGYSNSCLIRFLPARPSSNYRQRSCPCCRFARPHGGNDRDCLCPRAMDDRPMITEETAREIPYSVWRWRGLEMKHPLTPRQAQIVALIQQGMNNKEIARTLQISNGTVKAHLHVVFDRLSEHGITSRGKLAAYYRRPEIIFPTPGMPPPAPAARSPRPR